MADSNKAWPTPLLGHITKFSAKIKGSPKKEDERKEPSSPPLSPRALTPPGDAGGLSDGEGPDVAGGPASPSGSGSSGGSDGPFAHSSSEGGVEWRLAVLGSSGCGRRTLLEQWARELGGGPAREVRDGLWRLRLAPGSPDALLARLAAPKQLSCSAAIAHAHAVLLVFDATARASFLELSREIPRLAELLGPRPRLPALLVATHADLVELAPDTREVQESQAREVGRALSAPLAEAGGQSRAAALAAACNQLLREARNRAGPGRRLVAPASTPVRRDLPDLRFARPAESDAPDEADGKEPQPQPQPVPQVRAGSLPRLVEQLTYESYVDPQFVPTFLLTYRTFTSDTELLRLLELRFDDRLLDAPADVPEGSPPPLGEAEQERLEKIRFRVTSVLKQWVTSYWADDFEPHAELQAALQRFVDGRMQAAAPRLAAHVRSAMERRGKERNGPPSLKGAASAGQPPKPMLPKRLNERGRPDFMDMHPLELARQLTLLDATLYAAIRPRECIGCAWMRPETKQHAPTIVDMTNRFNVLAAYVRTLVVRTEKVRERAAVLLRFIKLASKLRALNNFHSLLAVLSGLESASVHRLRQTWLLVPQKRLDKLLNLKRLLDSKGGHKFLRTELRACSPPAVPYLGVFLGALFMLDEANKDLIDGGLINMKKRRMQADLVRELMQHQHSIYCLTDVPVIREHLMSLKAVTLDEDECYRLSLQVEPREARGSRAVTYNKLRQQVVHAPPSPALPPLQPLVAPVVASSTSPTPASLLTSSVDSQPLAGLVFSGSAALHESPPLMRAGSAESARRREELVAQLEASLRAAGSSGPASLVVLARDWADRLRLDAPAYVDRSAGPDVGALHVSFGQLLCASRLPELYLEAWLPHPPAPEHFPPLVELWTQLLPTTDTDDAAGPTADDLLRRVTNELHEGQAWKALQNDASLAELARSTIRLHRRVAPSREQLVARAQALRSQASLQAQLHVCSEPSTRVELTGQLVQAQRGLFDVLRASRLDAAGSRILLTQQALQTHCADSERLLRRARGECQKGSTVDHAKLSAVHGLERLVRAAATGLDERARSETQIQARVLAGVLHDTLASLQAHVDAILAALTALRGQLLAAAAPITADAAPPELAVALRMIDRVDEVEVLGNDLWQDLAKLPLRSTQGQAPAPRLFYTVLQIRSLERELEDRFPDLFAAINPTATIVPSLSTSSQPPPLQPSTSASLLPSVAGSGGGSGSGGSSGGGGATLVSPKVGRAREAWVASTHTAEAAQPLTASLHREGRPGPLDSSGRVQARHDVPADAPSLSPPLSPTHSPPLSPRSSPPSHAPHAPVLPVLPISDSLQALAAISVQSKGSRRGQPLSPQPAVGSAPTGTATSPLSPRTAASTVTGVAPRPAPAPLVSPRGDPAQTVPAPVTSPRDDSPSPLLSGSARRNLNRGAGVISREQHAQLQLQLAQATSSSAPPSGVTKQQQAPQAWQAPQLTRTASKLSALPPPPPPPEPAASPRSSLSHSLDRPAGTELGPPPLPLLGLPPLPPGERPTDTLIADIDSTLASLDMLCQQPPHS